MEVSIINVDILYVECTQENHTRPMNHIRFRKQRFMEHGGDLGNGEAKPAKKTARMASCTSSFCIQRGSTKTVQYAIRQMYQLEDGKQHTFIKHVNTNLGLMWVQVSKDITPSEIEKC
jgi:hypothetical protein